MAIVANVRCLFPVAAILLALSVGVRGGSYGYVTNFTVNGNATPYVQVVSGMPIKITCRAMYNSTNPPIVHIQKTDFTNVTWAIAENGDLDTAITAVGWMVDDTALGSLPAKTVEFVFTIQSAQNADSGNYSCKVGTNPVKFLTQVDVVSEPTMIVLTLNGQVLPPGQANQFKVTLGSPYSLSCNVSGGNPYPNVSLSTPSGPLMPTTTRTYWSAMYSAINTGYVNRSTNVTVNSVVFNVSMLGKPVTCFGGVRNPMAISTSFTPYSDSVVPQFQCGDSYLLIKSQTAAMITCQVLASNLTSANVTWTDSTKKNYTINGVVGTTVSLAADNSYSLKVEAPMSGSLYYKMTLNINNARAIKDLTTNMYQFRAMNAYGLAQHTVMVKAEGTVVGGATQTLSSTAGFLLTLMITATMAAVMM